MPSGHAPGVPKGMLWWEGMGQGGCDALGWCSRPVVAFDLNLTMKQSEWSVRSRGCMYDTD